MLGKYVQLVRIKTCLFYFRDFKNKMVSFKEMDRYLFQPIIRYNVLCFFEKILFLCSQ